MGTLNDHQGTCLRSWRGCTVNMSLMRNAVKILVDMFNIKSEVSSFAGVQTQGQTCVR